MDEREPQKPIIADKAQLARPVLAPHLQFRSIGNGQTLLVSEIFNTLLHGRIYPDLLALLDGRQTRDEIIGSLAGSHSENDVTAALSALSGKGYIVSGDYEMEQGKAAFWSSLGTSPRLAEKKLRAAKVAIHGNDDNRLAKCFADLGVAVGSDRPTLSVVLCDDYLDQRNDAINRVHLASGAPWVLIRPKGVLPLFGPIFRPGEDGPCWACLTYRMANNQEVHTFIRNHFGKASAFKPRAADPALLNIVYGMAAAEIAKWLVLHDAAPLHQKAFSLDVIKMKVATHPVMRRPQCAVCGDKALRSPDRPALPVKLQPSPKGPQTSGGMRAVAPVQTLEKYRHLVSLVSGIVTWVERVSTKADPWLHVHWAGSNLALRIKSLSSLRRSLRSKSAGKGSTAEQSEVSALCEAVERYSGAFHGDEIRCRSSFRDFHRAGDGKAIHPNDVQLFSDRQLNHAEAINARGHPYNVVPPRFDPDRELEWSPVWSLTEKRNRYLPTAMLYGMTPEQRGTAGLWADSNGCAAGNTREEAILQGFLELIERDAFAIWWYNRLSLPGVDLSRFDDDYLAAASEYYGKRNRDMWVLDLTGDLGIPVFVALSRRTDTDTEDIIYGAGAHIDPHIAVLRAVCEMNQCLTWVPQPGQDSGSYGVDDPMCLWWWKNARLSDHPYLAPNDKSAPRGRSDYPHPDTEDFRDDVEWCRALIEAKGMELLTLDQTRPDIRMPVARVIVPGLRHFWERFAPGRLYDVPVEMGWRKQAINEPNLNPVPVIA